MNELGQPLRTSGTQKQKKAVLAAEIVQLGRRSRRRRECLEHVDALLDPTLAVEAIPNKRLPKHVNLFRQGELGD